MKPETPTRPAPREPVSPRPGARPARLGLLVATVALASGLAGGVAGGMVVRTYGQQAEPLAGRPLVTQQVVAAGRAPADRVEAVARALLPAVVGVQAQDGTSRQAGSGVVLTADGYLLTNSHVVAGARTVAVTLAGGEMLPARLVGSAPALDLAVLKVARGGLPVPAFGSAAALKVGEPAIAVGGPFGFQGSVTSGVVSALHRVVAIGGDGAGQPAEDLVDAIQTDAAVDPGSSGGALATAGGEVVGITTAIATAGREGEAGQALPSAANAGVAFAIPIEQALEVARELMAGRHVPLPFIGVDAYADLSPELAAQYQLDGRAGALLKDVQAGGPAARAGLASGDMVIRVGNMAVRGPDGLKVAVRQAQVGQPVEVVVVRHGRALTVRVTPTDGSAG